jgi:hypothetical protein
MPKINEQNVTCVSSVQVIFPEDSVIKGDSCRFIDKTSDVELCDFGSI